MRTFVSATLLAALSAGACTIIRYKDPPGGGVVETREVDVLVVAPLDPAGADLAPSFEALLEATEKALDESNILVRKLALAPLYRRLGDEVPLLFGREEEKDPQGGDPLPLPGMGEDPIGREPGDGLDGGDGEFGMPGIVIPEPGGSAYFATFGQALSYYSSVEGNGYFTGPIERDGHNLALLGARLGDTPVFSPLNDTSHARAYFDEPADGFVVIVLIPTRRHCTPSDCAIEGVEQSEYFTRDDGDGAAWLSLLDQAHLPRGRIVHLFVSTQEGGPATDFYEKCEAISGMPAGLVDLLEPSPVLYVEPLVLGIGQRGGRAHRVSMCNALAKPKAVGRELAAAVDAAVWAP